MGNVIASFVWSNKFLLNFAKFEFSFFDFELNQSESLFYVVKDSVVFIHFWDFDNIHQSTREFGVSSDFVIDFDESFSL